MTKNSILLNTLKGNPSDRPPFWFMRQAGRVLPSYNKLKEKYTFWQLMQDPKLAAEVTLLPVNDLGVDAAILFSDILVIPYAMGMGLEFTDRGPEFDTPLVSIDNPIKALKPDPSRLTYIYNAIDEIIKTKPDNIPLIGFCGSPLTVLCYMLQGLSRKTEFPEAIKFIYKNKKVTKQLIDSIIELSLEYAEQQVAHGIEVFQLFETHAGLIPFELYRELFLPAVKKISQKLKSLNTPFIYFPKGIGSGIKEITPEHCNYLGVDWQTPLSLARELTHPGIGLQGNVDPRLLYATPQIIKEELNKLVPFGTKNNNWILNLGHGFLPDTPFESAKVLANWIKETNWNR